MAETVWSNKTFAHLREAIAQLLTKHVNVFFLYDQLEGPLSDFFKTSSTFNGNKMSNITTTLIHSAFEKPKKSNSYELYSTIFFEEEDYADYYIHVDKTNGKVACSKSESMEDIRSVDGNEASRWEGPSDLYLFECAILVETHRMRPIQTRQPLHSYQPPKCSLVNHACQL
mmetsp:Transcript_21476/g.36472  ORF Transcript_21476/g.36472 Transcript_21476/m.36472 type:complete len:171 (+) Transcript_21476:313-825(+)